MGRKQGGNLLFEVFHLTFEACEGFLPLLVDGRLDEAAKVDAERCKKFLNVLGDKAVVGSAGRTVVVFERDGFEAADKLGTV